MTANDYVLSEYKKSIFQIRKAQGLDGKAMKGGGGQTADEEDRRNMRGRSNANIRGATDRCPFYIPCGCSQCRRSLSCLLKEAFLRRHAVLLRGAPASKIAQIGLVLGSEAGYSPKASNPSIKEVESLLEVFVSANDLKSGSGSHDHGTRQGLSIQLSSGRV